MNRFKVQTGDGRTLLLYYPTQAEAQKHWPDAAIEACSDQSHIAYIQQILKIAQTHQTMERNGSIVHVLRLGTPAGICVVQLFQDSVDGVWYDLCKYQLWKTGTLLVPFMWDLSSPADFCQRFLFPQVEYTILSSGRSYKRPKDLRGIRKFTSVSFSKCKCQLFLKGDDLYIDHHDYFSPSWKPPADDIGKPMSYYLKKYFGQTKAEKFIYADCWGDIVLQNKAWLRITSFVPMVEILNARQVVQAVWPLIRVHHKWPSYERNMDWERFLEDVANTTRNYLTQGGENPDEIHISR